MNKAILIFGVLFLMIAGVVAGADYHEPAEESLISEKTDGQSVNIENDSLFAAKNDLEPPNEELQKYAVDQVEIEEKRVRITADKIGENYISGKAESIEAFRYGTFSFKVNTVKGTGLFPAIWLLPSQYDAAYPEVDIYELIGNEPDKAYGVLHYKENERKARDFFTHRFPKDDIPESYQIKFEWSRKYMKWYLNDELLYTIQKHVPQIPMYMILNLAVGGIWPGNPDENTEFPAVFDVEVLEFKPEEIYLR